MPQMALAEVDMRAEVIKSTEAETNPLHLTTKSSIIDEELNRHGMGRYQWLMWTICGMGIFLDVLWAQSVGLVTSNIQREFGFSDKEFGNIGSAVASGITAGAFVWGILVDIVGRRVAFLGTSLVAGVFGMFLGAQSSYSGLLVIIAFTGFGVGGNVPIDVTIAAEYLPADRFYLLTALSIFTPLGFVASSLIAFGFMPNYSCSTTLVSCHLTGGVAPCCSKDGNMGWRYFFFTISSITLGVFIIRSFIFPFYESPKFLLSKGDDKGAVEVIHKIAAFNKRTCDLTVESLYERSKENPVVERMGFRRRLVSEVSRLRLLFGSWRMARITITIWVTWMFACFGYYTAGAFLPAILQRKNSAIRVSLKQTYIDYLIIYTPGIVAVILSSLMVRAPMVGRKLTLVVSSTVMSVSLFLYSIVNTEANYVGLNVLENFCQCFFTSALFGWTPEAFPTAVRGTAAGLATFFGNLLGISGPLVAAQLFGSAGGSNAVLYLAASSVFACTLTLLCLPTKDMVAPR